MPELPRTRPLIGAYLVPALAAASWAGILVMARAQGLATQRSLIFIGGPLLAFAGLHARLFPFLHAEERWRWIHLPLEAGAHWRASARGHGPASAYSLALGVLMVLASCPGGELGRGWSTSAALAVEFAWFGLMALCLEPVASAIAALLGRRFEPESSASELQRSLGGGWTTPEAVIHLYAPAFAIGAAALLALPGQLSWERWVDGNAVTREQLVASLLPLALAVTARAGAGRIYARGFWQAIPWLREASRTLAGPPQPESTPAWMHALPPHLRLVTIEFWRSTPLPGLRLFILLALAVVFVMRGEIQGPGLALAVAGCASWLVPAGALWRTRSQRRRLCQALPLPSAQRAGSLGWEPIALLLSPVVLVLVAVFWAMW